MQRPLCLICCLALLSMIRADAVEPALDTPALPVVEAVLTPTHISESREKDLAKMEFQISSDRSLTVTVRGEGEAFKEARGWGGVIVTEAVDDTGHDLQLPKRKPARKAHRHHAGETAREKAEADAADAADDDDADDDADANEYFTVLEPLIGSRDRELLIEIGLALPPRKAIRIARLRGELTLMRGGEIREITIANLPDLLGKSIDDPALTAAGLEVSIMHVGQNPADEDKSTLKLKLKGHPVAFSKAEVSDADGKSASSGSEQRAPRLADTELEMSFQLKEPLNNAMVLKLYVIVGQEAVRVPFDLKDIALP